MARVINARSGTRDERCIYVYVGRNMAGWQESPLGNPFRMRSEIDRDRVIASYRAWLWDKVKTRKGSVYQELLRLQKLDRDKLRLVCWCAPRACHAEVILNCLAWMDRQ